MSKKQKRQVSSGKGQPETTERSTFSLSNARSSFSTEFAPDYSHIISDLKRIAILAVAFMVILFVLSIFIK